MPPRRRSASGYRGVRGHPIGGFYAEIRSGDLRLSLDTYDTAHEAARAFDAAAWRLGRPRHQINFQDVHTLQQALDVAPPPRVNSAQDRTEHTARQRRLLVAQEDEGSWRTGAGTTRRTSPTSRVIGQGAARRTRAGAARSGWARLEDTLVRRATQLNTVDMQC
ncbi:putative AP2 protein [Hordeum vulgare]|nr:putative AP2 protein [Hordeum vulgare]